MDFCTIAVWTLQVSAPESYLQLLVGTPLHGEAVHARTVSS